jgi:hypothetical protein
MNITEIDLILTSLRALWLGSGIKGMNKYIPQINKMLDKRLKLMKSA